MLTGSGVLWIALAWSLLSRQLAQRWLLGADPRWYPAVRPPPVPEEGLYLLTFYVLPFALYNFAYAVMARVLITAAEDAKATGKELDQEAGK